MVKKRFGNKQMVWRYGFAFVLVLLGLVLQYYNIGKDFLGFESVGTWLIFVGFIMFVVITLQKISNKKRIVDERMEAIAYKASRATFIFIIFGAFAVMILDGINPITIRYSMFMSHMIAWIVLVYFISYKILEKFN